MSESSLAITEQTSTAIVAVSTLEDAFHRAASAAQLFRSLNMEGMNVNFINSLQTNLVGVEQEIVDAAAAQGALNQEMKNASAFAKAIGMQFTAIQGKLGAMMLEKTFEFFDSALKLSITGVPTEQIEKVKNAFSEMQTTVARQFAPVMTGVFGMLAANAPQLGQVLSFLGGGIAGIISFFSVLGEMAIQVTSIITECWGLIGPILLGGLILLAKHFLMLKVAAIKSAISSARTWLAANWPLLLMAVAIGMIIIVLGQMGVSFEMVAGVIGGALAVIGAAIANTFMGMVDIIFGLIAHMYNRIAGVANFLANVFTDPLGAAVKLFFGFADSVLGVIESIARALDKVFGSSLADTVAGWRTEVKVMADMAYEKMSNGAEYKEILAPKDAKEIMESLNIDLERFGYQDAAKAGYDKGVKFAESFSGMGELFAGINNSTQDTADNTNAIAGNTSAMANGMELNNDELEYLRDLAERETINKFTTAQVRVEVGGVHQTMASYSNANEVVEQILSGFCEGLACAAHGVQNV